MTAERLDVFISHSAKDAELARSIAKLLVNTLGIPVNRIRCSSAHEFMFPPNGEFNNEVRREAIEARIFIGLITEHSINSTSSQYALGARWGSGQKLIPLLGPGCDPYTVEGQFQDSHPISFNSDSIINLLESISKETGFTLQNRPGLNKVVGKIIKLYEESSKSSSDQTEGAREDSDSAKINNDSQFPTIKAESLEAEVRDDEPTEKESVLFDDSNMIAQKESSSSSIVISYDIVLLCRLAEGNPVSLKQKSDHIKLTDSKQFSEIITGSEMRSMLPAIRRLVKADLIESKTLERRGDELDCVIEVTDDGYELNQMYQNM